VVIDLRHAAVTSFETEITAVALGGEVRIIVPPGVPAGLSRAVAAFGRADARCSDARPVR
jgi:predicted membrane protein